MIPGYPHLGELVLDDPTRRLCAAIASGGGAPVRLALIAPGGHGKTALLGHIADGAGAVPYQRGGVASDALVLVDDAHLLSAHDLAELREHVAHGRGGVIVAARPRPRPAGLTALLGRLHGQIVLRPFDHARVAQYLREVRGAAPEPGTVEFVLRQTGGVPGLVHRLAPYAGVDRRVPEAVVEQFRFDVERLAPDALRVLLAAELGAASDTALLADLLELPATAVSDLVDEVRGTGLLAVDGRPLPLIVAVLREVVPADQRAAVSTALAEAYRARGGVPQTFAAALLEARAAGPSVAAALESAATTAEPAVAVRLYSAAAAAGHPVDDVRRAEAEALAGDLDSALRRADALVAAGRADAAPIVAAALAHRGQLARSAELYQWSGGGPAAAITLAGTGALTAARAALTDAGDQPPTLLAGALSALANGVLESIEADAATALSTVVRSAEMLEPVGARALLPDSPAAVGALLALHTGALGIAEPLLDRAIAARVGGAAMAPRHRILRRWVAMLRGDTDSGDALCPGVGGATVLAPRDWLFAVGVEVGLARRASDLPALRRIWSQACEAVVRQPVDLFTLLPLGEFAAASARLGDQARLTPHLEQAWALLADLGDPPAWATMLHWNCLHAEIHAEHPDAAESHVAALAAMADAGPFHATIAEAARCWLDVLTGQVNAQRVDASARALHGQGLRWDAARLAGQAAIRTADRRAMVTLLERARTLQGHAEADDTMPSPLSERETQVARLVVDGLTYREVGDRLFISAKTVEHHMARMRSRLGATSRADLLSQLRDLVR